MKEKSYCVQIVGRDNSRNIIRLLINALILPVNVRPAGNKDFRQGLQSNLRIRLFSSKNPWPVPSEFLSGSLLCSALYIGPFLSG